MKPVDAAYRQQNLFANPAWMMKQVTKTWVCKSGYCDREILVQHNYTWSYYPANCWLNTEMQGPNPDLENNLNKVGVMIYI